VCWGPRFGRAVTKQKKKNSLKKRRSAFKGKKSREPHGPVPKKVKEAGSVWAGPNSTNSKKNEKVLFVTRTNLIWSKPKKKKEKNWKTKLNPKEEAHRLRQTGKTWKKETGSEKIKKTKKNTSQPRKSKGVGQSIEEGACGLSRPDRRGKGTETRAVPSKERQPPGAQKSGGGAPAGGPESSRWGRKKG